MPLETPYYRSHNKSHAITYWAMTDPERILLFAISILAAYVLHSALLTSAFAHCFLAVFVAAPGSLQYTSMVPTLAINAISYRHQ